MDAGLKVLKVISTHSTQWTGFISRVLHYSQHVTIAGKTVCITRWVQILLIYIQIIKEVIVTEINTGHFIMFSVISDYKYL
jgi:hypothetical protein